MRNDRSEFVAGKPDVQMKCWRLNSERRRQISVEIERNRMIRRWAYGCCRAGKARQRRAVHVPRRDQPRALMLPQNGGEFSSIAQILYVHMADTGDKRRVVQKKQRRTRRRGRQNTLQPSEGVRIERPVVPTRHDRDRSARHRFRGSRAGNAGRPPRAHSRQARPRASNRDRHDCPAPRRTESQVATVAERGGRKRPCTVHQLDRRK